MYKRFLAALAGLVALTGCAAAPDFATAPDHPASADAAPAPLPPQSGVLATADPLAPGDPPPVAQPDHAHHQQQAAPHQPTPAGPGSLPG